MAFQPNRLGQGVGNALKSIGNRFAGYFANRAQNQYQEGVGHISDAKTRVDEIDALAASPNVALNAQEQAALNNLRSYWDQVQRMTPWEARSFVQENEPPDATIERVVKQREKARERPSTRQGGMSAGAPPQAEVRETETTAGPAFFNQLARRAAVGQRAYDEEAYRTRVGIDTEAERSLMDVAHSHNLAELDVRQAFEAEQSALDRGAQFDLQAYAQEHDLDVTNLQAALQDDNARRAWLRDEITRDRNIDREGAIARIQQVLGLERLQAETMAQNWLGEQADTRAVEGQMAVGEVAAARNAVSAATEAYRAGDMQAQGELEYWAEREDVPSYIREQARAALAGDATAMQEARASELEAAIARNEEVGEQASLETQRMRDELDLLQRDIQIADQQIALGDIQMDTAELQNRRENFNLRADEWRLSDDQRGAATEYVTEAIEIGLPGRIQDLIDARNDPEHPLYGLARQASEAQLNEAMAAAVDTKNLTGRQQELADAQINQAFREIRTGELSSRADLVETVASAYAPEEIANNPDLARLVEEGMLTQSDVDAMQTRSRLYRQLEQDEVNGPRLQVYTQRLQQYNQPENFPDPQDAEAVADAEAGLRSTLNELVSLGYMNPDEVEGLVSLYKSGWANRDQAFRTDLAQAEAQMALTRSQGALNNARRGEVEGGGSGLDLDFVKVQQELINDAISAVEQEADVAGCLDPTGAISNRDQCSNYQARISGFRDDLVNLRRMMRGDTGVNFGDDLELPGDMTRDQYMAVEAQRILSDPNATSDTDRADLNGIIQYFGGPDEFEAALGLQSEEIENPQGEAGSSYFRRVFQALNPTTPPPSYPGDGRGGTPANGGTGTGSQSVGPGLSRILTKVAENGWSNLTIPERQQLMGAINQFDGDSSTPEGIQRGIDNMLEAAGIAAPNRGQ